MIANGLELPKFRKIWLLLGMLGLVPASLWADEHDAFNFVISQTVLHDSNLYRLPSGEPAPEGKREDTISTTELAVRFDRTYSRQRLRADLGLTHAAYRIHDSLDYTAPDLFFAWDWAVGSRWSGLVTHADRETMAGFEDALRTEQLVRQFTRTGVSADYWWHPSWTTGLDASRVENEYKDNVRPASEYEADAVGASLVYRPSSGNQLALVVRQTNGQYPNRPKIPGSIRDYQQRDARLRMNWAATGQITVSGYVGHSVRTYDLAPNRDFSGATGRVALRWALTGKTALDLLWRREIGAEEDLVANYAVVRAVSVAPSWAMTEKLRLRFRAEQAARDYGGDPELGFAGVDKDERTRTLELSLQYEPMRALFVELGVRRMERDSDLARRDYTANAAYISGRFAF